MTPAHARFKLGKQAPRFDHRTLRLAEYFRPEVPLVAPQNCAWERPGTAWGVMLNDQIGDCAIAAPGHLIGMWTKDATGKEALVSDQQILAAYEDVSGYVPGVPSTDAGCVMLDVLNYWKAAGIGGHKILGFVSVNPASIAQMRLAIWLFGGVMVGIQLPLSCQPQIGHVWDVPPTGTAGDGEPGSWGGHCVPVVQYTSATFNTVTWGATQLMTNRFWLTYGDEAYAILTQDWLSSANQKSPSGFNLAQLQADLKLV